MPVVVHVGKLSVELTDLGYCTATLTSSACSLFHRTQLRPLPPPFSCARLQPFYLHAGEVEEAKSEVALARCATVC